MANARSVVGLGARQIGGASKPSLIVHRLSAAVRFPPAHQSQSPTGRAKWLICIGAVTRVLASEERDTRRDGKEGRKPVVVEERGPQTVARNRASIGLWPG